MANPSFRPGIRRAQPVAETVIETVEVATAPPEEPVGICGGPIGEPGPLGEPGPHGAEETKAVEDPPPAVVTPEPSVIAPLPPTKPE